MKTTYRVLLLSAFIFIATSSLFSQINFGLKTGMNISNINVRGDEDLIENIYHPLLLLHFGFVGSVDINEHFSFSPELLYTQKGSQNSMIKPSDSRWEMRMSYLSIPLMFQYNLKGVGIQLGPEIGYLLDYKNFIDNVETFNPVFENTKVGLSMNVGFKYSHQKFFAEARWQRGLIPINKFTYTDANGQDIGVVRFYYNTFQFSVGYMLR